MQFQKESRVNKHAEQKSATAGKLKYALASVLTLCVMMFAFTLTVSAAANSFTVNGNASHNFDNLQAAINAAATATTIVLTDDITHNESELYFDGFDSRKNITIDLNGHTLTMDSSVIRVVESTFTINRTGGGTLAFSNSNNGIWASYESIVTINADITGLVSGNSPANGVYAENSTVTVNGNVSVSGAGSTGINAIEDAVVTVNGNVSASGSGSHGVMATDSSTVTIDGTVTGDIFLNGADTNVHFNRSGNHVFSGSISGTGSLIKSATGTLELSGNSTYTGSTTINAGTLQIGNSLLGSGGIYAGNIINNGTLLFFHASGYSQTLSGVISGTGNIALQGTGTLTLSGANTYSGNTNVNGGHIILANDYTIASGRTLLIQSFGGQLFTVNDGVTLTNNGTINNQRSFINNGTVSDNGTIANSGTITNNGTINTAAAENSLGHITNNGTVNYNTPKTWNSNTPPTVANGNTVIITADATGTLNIPDNATVTLTREGTGEMSFSGNIAIGTGGTLVFDYTETMTANGTISGAGSVIKRGAGQLLLGGNNTYSGGTMLNQGQLLINNLTSNSSVFGTGSITFNGSNMRVESSAPLALTIANDIILNQNATIQIDTAATVTFSGVISGTGNLTKGSGGEMILAGANTYSGSTIISAGTLILDSDYTVPASRTLELQSSTTRLIINEGKTLTNNGTINNGTTNISGSTITNNGTIVNNNAFTNNNVFTNNGTVSNAGTITSTHANSSINNTVGKINNTASGSVNGTVTGNQPTDFGDVPATGIPPITGYLIAMLGFFGVSATMWAFVLRRKFARILN